MAISIGSFYNTGGKNVLGGAGGSGIDTKTLVEGLVEARKIPVKALEDRITANTSRSTAFSELKTLMTKLKDSADLLRNVPGFGKQASNAFDFRTTNISSNTSVSGSTYLSVTAEPGTQAQSISIDEIKQLAKARRQQTGTIAVANADASVVSASPATGFFKNGTFTLKGSNITLELGDSLNTVASKFNAVRSETGIRASVIKVAENNFKLQFAADKTGLSANFDMDNGDITSVVDASGVLTQLTFTDTQDAQNAQIKLDGSLSYIERETNNISDIVTGITFNLKQETPALTELTLSIDADNTVAKNAIIGFVNAYNDIRIFSAKQSQVGTDGKYTKDAVLATSSTLRATLSSISNELSGIVQGLSGSDPKRLSDLGIVLTDLQETEDNPFTRNIMTLDESKLDKALSSNFDAVRKVFEFNFRSSNSNLVAFTRTNALGVNSFSLEIQPTAIAARQLSGTFAIATADTAAVTASATSGFFTAGTFTLKKGAVTQDITLVDGDSLNAVAAKFNAVKSTTGIGAVVVAVGTNDFKLQLTSETAGTANAFDINSAATLVDPSSVFTPITFATTQTAKDVTFQASYVDSSDNQVAIPTRQLTRSFNIANAATAAVTAAPTSGFFTAGTFTLKGESITLVDGDTLDDVVGKFNAVRGTTGIGANVVNGGAGNFKIEFIADVAGTVGAFDMNSAATLVDATGVFAQTSVETTQFAANPAGPRKVNLTATPFDSGVGYSLVGQTGTVLEGLNLLYAVNTAATMTVSMTQGIGDRLFNLADSVLKDETGMLAIEQDSIKTRNEKLQSDIDRLNKQIEVYRQQLLDRFAALEAAIARSNNILDSITANNEARNNA